MGFWKGLVDKVAQKKEELEEEAKKRAAKKAAEMALDTGKAAAKAAVKNAGRTLDYAGKKLEEAIFGSASSDGDDAPQSASGKKPSQPPDPFAKLKAEEAAKKERDRESRRVNHTTRASEGRSEAEAKSREQARAKTEREVDDELAALKKKIRGQ